VEDKIMEKAEEVKKIAMDKELADEKGCQTKDSVLCILREAIGEDSFCELAIRGLWCILQKKVLQQNVYAKRILENWENRSVLEKFSFNFSQYKSSDITEELLRNLWKDWKAGCSPYRQKLSEQRFGELTGFVQELSQQDSSEEIFLQNLWETSRMQGILQQTLPEIQEIWKSFNGKQRSRTRYAIRKLTENETWRLMGFSDKDFNAAKSSGVSRTQLYRQAGNSIVRQVLMAIFLQMGIQGKPRWNDMSIEERQKMVDDSLDFIS
jgi:hypothetical protein